jgi:hypothetical protein
MLRKSVLLGGIVLASLASQAARADALAPASQWIPKEAFAVVEVTQPKPLLDLALEAKTAAAVQSLPGYQKQTAQPG